MAASLRRLSYLEKPQNWGVLYDNKSLDCINQEFHKVASEALLMEKREVKEDEATPRTERLSYRRLRPSQGWAAS